MFQRLWAESFANIAICSYYENFPDDYDFDSSSACLVGLGMGLLASAAVSLSPALPDLPRAGAEVVRMAFRLGVVVDEVSQNLEPRDIGGAPESWACVISEVTEKTVQTELDVIQAQSVLFIRVIVKRFSANNNRRTFRSQARFSSAPPEKAR